MKDTQKLIALLVGVALLVAVVVAATFWAFGKIEETGKARNQNYAIIIHANALLTELIDAETGQRGYLLTRDKAFLKPYILVRDSVGAHLKELRSLSLLSAAHKLPDTLTLLINAKMMFMSQSIELCRNNNMTDALLVVNSGRGKLLMDSIRAEMQSFIRFQDDALAQHDAELKESMSHLFTIIVAVSLLMLLFVILLVYLIYNETQQQIKKTVYLETQRLLALGEEANKQLQQANATLQISEEKLAVTLSSIGDGVLATDEYGNVLLLNPVAQQLTGWTQEEAQGLPVDDIFHIINQESHLPTVVPIKETLEKGTIQGLANHTILISRLGSECVIADSCALIKNREGKVVGAVLVFRDVTQEYAEREYFESVINTVRDSMITLDHDLRVVSVSRSFYEVFKVNPEETIGQLIYDLGNKQWNIPKLRELLETILPQKTTFDNYEVEHDFITIGKRTMLLNARQIQSPVGKDRKILLSIEDITSRKNIENELLDTRMELERIVQAQRVVIIDTKESLDHETKGRLIEEGEISHRQEALEVVYAMETAFDSTMETLCDQIVLSIATTLHAPLVAIDEFRNGKIVKGSRCLDNCVSPSNVSAPLCAACLSVLRDEKHACQYSGELGSQFDELLCFDPLRFHSYLGVEINGSQNEVCGMITVLDEKIRTFTNSEIQFIETFGRYIAHELSRRDLELRLRRGEEMRLLGQLTSGVAHEVRNPLNGILAIMGALSKEIGDNENFEPYMKHMRDQITRLTVLMEDLLVLGRPLREENRHEISMVTLVENAIASWLQTVESVKPHVLFNKPEYEPEKYIIRADSLYITQIIINLLQNACNHSAAGAEIICSVYGQNDHAVVFSVKDCGTGIPQEILPRIFDPFFTTRKGGTGLGLSIVKDLVEKHQGSVTAHNNTGGPGATFEILLPIYNVNQIDNK